VGERLATLGYVVGAPDVFWRIQPNWESDHTPEGVEASLGMIPKFDFPQGVADCVAALHALEGLPEVQGGAGVVGFCLGGTLGYLTAAVAGPACCVSYYGSGIAGMLDQLDNIECPVLFHFGDADVYIPGDQISAIEAAIEGRAVRSTPSRAGTPSTTTRRPCSGTRPSRSPRGETTASSPPPPDQLKRSGARPGGAGGARPRGAPAAGSATRATACARAAPAG
jgi:hypothetical protein